MLTSFLGHRTHRKTKPPLFFIKIFASLPACQEDEILAQIFAKKITADTTNIPLFSQPAPVNPRLSVKSGKKLKISPSPFPPLSFFLFPSLHSRTKFLPPLNTEPNPHSLFPSLPWARSVSDRWTSRLPGKRRGGGGWTEKIRQYFRKNLYFCISATKWAKIFDFTGFFCRCWFLYLCLKSGHEPSFEPFPLFPWTKRSSWVTAAKTLISPPPFSYQNGRFGGGFGGFGGGGFGNRRRRRRRRGFKGIYFRTHAVTQLSRGEWAYSRNASPPLLTNYRNILEFFEHLRHMPSNQEILYFGQSF